MASYSEIVKGIRSRFVGNAEEHELLIALQKDFSAAESEARKRIEDEYRERNQALSLREVRLNAMAGYGMIDDAVFDWLRSDANDNWTFSHVIGAMRGRGLGPEHLEKIANAMKSD